MGKSTYTTESFWSSMSDDPCRFEFIETMPWADHWYEECKAFDGWTPFQGYSAVFPGRFSHFPTKEDFPSITAYFQGKPNYIQPELMKLEPGAIIPPHAHIKTSHYHADEYLYNMAINYPEGCKFGFIEGGMIPYKQGDVYKLYINYDHCVVNDSNEDRYHLVWKDKNAS